MAKLAVSSAVYRGLTDDAVGRFPVQSFDIATGRRLLCGTHLPIFELGVLEFVLSAGSCRGVLDMIHTLLMQNVALAFTIRNIPSTIIGQNIHRFSHYVCLVCCARHWRPERCMKKLPNCIRQRIFSRELEPGSWIDELQIAKAYRHQPNALARGS
jgi:hypothetical protein